MLEQKNKNSFIIVKGKVFKGVEKLGHRWERFLVPDWEDTIGTPSLAADIIDWCFIVENVINVNYKGEIQKSHSSVR